MKNRLHLTLLVVAIFFCLSDSNKIVAQTFFQLDSIEISPTNPTDVDVIAFRLFGTKSDSCSYLDTFEYSIIGFDLDIFMDWDTSTVVACDSMEVPWDTTIVIGVQAAGLYSINLDGDGFVDSTNQTLEFTVEASNDPCGSNPIIWVTTTLDSGPGSLREAINCANNTPGPNQIYFNIPGNDDQVIEVGEISGDSLPPLTDPGTIIDGTTQPSYGLNGDFSPKIILVGISSYLVPYNGIEINTSDVEIYGLEIVNFPYNGIYVNNGTNITIGQTGKGNVIYQNGGILDVYPGYDPELQFNGSGIHFFNSNACTVTGNTIGTDETLTGGNSNEYSGIFIEGGGNGFVIGSFATGAGNVIAHNPQGLVIENNSTNCSIKGNEFFCNSNSGINFLGNVNGGILPPIIELATAEMIQGTASVNGSIDVYLSDVGICGNSPCQGYTYLGSTTATGGAWTLNAPFAASDTLSTGQEVTAQLTGSSSNSSEFAICAVSTGTSACTDSIGQILVTNTNDSGAGSLYEALLCADTTVGSNVIIFDIPGTGPHTIFVGATTGLPLPTLTDVGTIIDGTSQPGYGAGGDFTPQIILNGGNTAWTLPSEGLLIQGDYTRVHAIQLVNFPNDAIKLDGAKNCMLTDNVIFNNGDAADSFPGLPGQGPFEGSGIVLENSATNNHISNNYIGTDYSETITAGNEYCGILINSNCSNNEIGGVDKSNVIANNAEGIRIKNFTHAIRISQNSIYCNDTIAIKLEGGANNGIPLTEFSLSNFTSLTSLSGFITSFISPENSPLLGTSIELYLNDDSACTSAPCQGKVFLGSSPLTGGSWQITAPFEGGVTLENGDLLTAIFIDGQGNTSEFTECYIAADCALQITPDVVDETCGLDNGSITFITTGGPAPYEYDMGLGVQSSNFFDNLNEGTYTVTVTDAYLCTTTAFATLTDSPVPTVSTTNVEGEVCDMQNGSFVAVGANGTEPYLYNIGFGQSGSNFFGLDAGNYTVTVTDVLGCTATELVNIPFIPGPTLSVASATDETCSSGDGIMVFNTPTGQPIFTYTIGFGNQTNPTFEGLVAGTYTATVTDDNGCTDTATGSIIDIPGPSTASTINVEDASCGLPSGSFTVTVDGGTEPYGYDIGDGAQGSQNFSGLLAGSYVVTVTDNNFCTITTSVTLGDIPGPGITVEGTTPANCGQANGSITVSGNSGTPPYVFDLGNGTQSNSNFNGLAADTYFVTVTDMNGCTAEVEAVINDILGPTLSISNQTDESCELDNGSVTIFASGGTDPYIYNIGLGNTSSPTFNNLSAGSYSVTVTDAATCQTIIDVDLINIGQFPTASYLYNDIDGTVSFSNTSLFGGSYNWDFGDTNTTTDPNPTHTFANSGTYNVCLTANNDCGPDTYCEMITVVVPPSIVSISGQIEKENGQLVSTVDLTCTGQAAIENNVDGTYTFDMITVGGTYVVDPQKDTLYGNGVSTFDVFIIQKHVLFVDTLDSPYKIIASDVNHNGGVSTFDTYLMQQVILNNVDTFPNNESWRFVPKDYVFMNPSFPLQENFPETLTLTNIQADAINQDFIAIKVGDVTLNADPGFTSGTIEELPLMIDERVLVKDSYIDVAFNLAEAKTLAAMQFELAFDAEVLQLEEILEADVAGINSNSFGQKFVQEGRLIFAWFDTGGYGQDIATDQALFTLRFKVNKDGGRLSDYLGLGNPEMNNLAFEPDGSNSELITVFATTTPTSNPEKGYSLQSQPNPFSDYTQVQVILPQAERGTVKVYDISGKVIFQKAINFQKGVNQFTIEAEDLPANGLYYLQVETEGFSRVAKLLLQ